MDDLSVNPYTKLCAVLGYPVRHSASPAMQNAGIQTLGVNLRYLALETHPDDLGRAIDGAKALRFAGLNLTVPHKLLAIPMMDALDASARTWGAVNTVRLEGRTEGGEWIPIAQSDVTFSEIRTHGFNTDADAITRSIREDLDLPIKGSRILLLGAGGAGRVAALKLAEEGAHLWLVNRTLEKATAVKQEIQQRFPACQVEVGYPGDVVDLVINATSAGLKPEDPLPFDTARLDLGAVASAYDMIYQPAETPFLKLARESGCRTANGLGMLLYQGAKALEIWTGKEAPLQAMKEALHSAVYGIR